MSRWSYHRRRAHICPKSLRRDVAAARNAQTNCPIILGVRINILPHAAASIPSCVSANVLPVSAWMASLPVYSFQRVIVTSQYTGSTYHFSKPPTDTLGTCLLSCHRRRKQTFSESLTALSVGQLCYLLGSGSSVQ